MDRGKFFALDCHYVDFDGKIFGEANAILEIEEFRGARSIDSLRVFPLAYHHKEEEMREKLIARGRKFGDLKGMHYRMYKGIAYFKRKRGFVKVNVNGRVMIDPSTFRRINPNYRMAPVKEFGGPNGGRIKNDDDDDEDEEGGCGHNSDDDDDEDEGDGINITATTSKTKASTLKTLAAAARRAQITRRTYITNAAGKIELVLGGAGGKHRDGSKGEDVVKEETELEPGKMTEEELLICSPTVLGFSFADKLWGKLYKSNLPSSGM